MVKQLYGDLPTLPDAEKLYDYLSKLFCKNVRDITIMCDKKEYRVLTATKKMKPI